MKEAQHVCVAAAGAKPSGCPVGAGLSHATATPARAWVLCVGEREEVDVGLYFYNLLSYLHPACAHEACVLSIHQCVLSDGIPPLPLFSPLLPLRLASSKTWFSALALAAARRDTRMCAFSALMHFSTDLHAAGGLPSRVAEPACEIVRLGRKISMERMWTAGGQGEPAAERRSWRCE